MESKARDGEGLIDIMRKLAGVSLRSIVHARRRQRASRAARAMFRRYQALHSVRKLHIGAGGSPLEGWLNVDLEPLMPQIAFLDASEPYPADANTFDYVHSEHVFEHLSFAEQQRMLAEVYRVLRPGGILRTATPDFDVIVGLSSDRSTFAAEYRSWSARAHFPAQLAEIGEVAMTDVFVVNNYFYSWGHRFIHNRLSLRTVLERAGFHDVREVAVGQSEDPALRDLERHGTVIPEEYNRFETIVFEAVR